MKMGKWGGAVDIWIWQQIFAQLDISISWMSHQMQKL